MITATLIALAVFAVIALLVVIAIIGGSKHEPAYPELLIDGDSEANDFSTAVPTQEQRYMSLELALEKNTAALNSLAEVIGKAKLQAHPEQPSKAATKAQDAPAPAKVPTPEAVAANAAAEAAKAAAPDYEKVVNPLILKCAQVTTKATAISILNTFTSADGKPCSNGKHVKPEDYSALVAKLNAAIAAASSSGDSLV